jgi:GH25 family lysozyme M1 (1,4-beta-N-acetylmuramidase)
MAIQSFGIDLSHHQKSAFQPWDKYAGKVDFVICRASYGGLLRDREVISHMQHARGIGAKVGLYQFFRPGQSVDQHWDQLRAVADLVKLGEGDIVPALDIERDPLPAPGADVSPAWAAACEELVGRIVDTFGDALVYITQREFNLLGAPKWVLARPLWVAHYTNAQKPLTPNNVAPTIWQHRVGPFDPEGPGGYDKAHPELDHNRGLGALPLIGAAPDAGLDDLRDAAVFTLPETVIIA